VTARRRKTGLAPGIALFLLGAIDAAAEGRRWIADSDPEIATVIYGTPESDDMVLNLTCERASKTLSVWFAPQPVPLRTPAEMPMTISSENGQVELKAAGNRSDLDDFYSLEAHTPMTPDVEKLLTGAKVVSLKVENRKTDMPLDDIALAGMEELVKACRK
jgi:hypothetical protein